MKLYTRGTTQEQLLFLLLGIQTGDDLDGKLERKERCGLLLGKDDQLPVEWGQGLKLQPYLRLPDTDHPLRETEELARLLARAIGQGEIHL